MSKRIERSEYGKAVLEGAACYADVRVTFEIGHKHNVAILMLTCGKSQRVVFPATGGDLARGPLNTRAVVKRVLRELGAIKK